jgi:hypothetical protein
MAGQVTAIVPPFPSAFQAVQTKESGDGLHGLGSVVAP